MRALLLLLAIAAVAGDERPFHIPTTAMEPAIHKDEDVLARNLEASEQLARSEVVVFQHPLDPKTVLVKRIVGLPGETVECRSKKLYVNGMPLAEPYVIHNDSKVFNDSSLPEPYRSRDNFGPLKLKSDEYFVLGDNRDSSSDSRYWGPVARRSIKARVTKVGPAAGPFRPIGQTE